MSDGTNNYPWYDVVVGASLAQGDILPACPVLVPSAPMQPDGLSAEANASLEANVVRNDVVVMTQACDLAQAKVEFVVLCPVWSLTKLAATNPTSGQAKKEKEILNTNEDIRRGIRPAYHMLAGHDDTEFPISVVEFHHIFSVPKGYLEVVAKNAGPRLRLLPPYREHLAQAFARYFMRVGLPIDIPPFR